MLVDDDGEEEVGGAEGGAVANSEADILVEVASEGKTEKGSTLLSGKRRAGVFTQTYTHSEPTVSSFVHNVAEQRWGLNITQDATDSFDLDNILCNFYRNSSLACVSTPFKGQYNKTKMTDEKFRGDGIVNSNSLAIRESAPVPNSRGYDDDYFYWLEQLGIPAHSTIYLNEQKEYNKTASNNYNLWPHFKRRRVRALPTDSAPSFASKFSPHCTNDDMADRQIVFLSNKLVCQSIPRLRLGHLSWADDNILFPKSLYVEPFRPVPECLRLLVRKNAYLLDEVIDDGEKNAMEQAAERLSVFNDSDIKIKSHLSQNSIQLGKNGSINPPFIDSAEYNVLESMLSRHLEGVVDATIHSTFGFFEEYCKSLSSELPDKNVDNKNISGSSSNSISNCNSNCKKDKSDFLNIKFPLISDERDKKMSRAKKASSKDSDESEDENFNSTKKKSIFDDAAFNTSSSAINDEPNLINWEDILCMLQNRANELVVDNSMNLRVDGDNLPDLRLSPMVIQRTQNRILSLFAGSDKSCDQSEPNKILEVKIREK